MIVLKRINNNAVLCVDSAGHRVVALGKGLAQACVGEKLDLDLIDHTFYDVEPRYVELMRDLDLECLETSTQIVDVARGMLTHSLSPNIEIAMADHLQFAIQRMREHIYLSAPLAYDLQQNYPLEYKIAQWSLALVKKELGVTLPNNEISGIAMCLINGAYGPSESRAGGTAEQHDVLLEQIVEIVEANMGVSVDREGFGFASSRPTWGSRLTARASASHASPPMCSTFSAALCPARQSHRRTPICTLWQLRTTRPHPHA